MSDQNRLLGHDCTVPSQREPDLGSETTLPGMSRQFVSREAYMSNRRLLRWAFGNRPLGHVAYGWHEGGRHRCSDCGQTGDRDEDIHADGVAKHAADQHQG